MTDRLIATIPKSGREDIRVSIRDFRGRLAIDIRVHADDGRERKATPKGVAIKPEMVSDLIKALQEAHLHLRPL